MVVTAQFPQYAGLRMNNLDVKALRDIFELLQVTLRVQTSMMNSVVTLASLPAASARWLVAFVRPECCSSLTVHPPMPQGHFPERLSQLWFLNAPFIFWGLWRLVSPFIEPATRDKIVFLSGAERAARLQAAIPPQVPCSRQRRHTSKHWPPACTAHHVIRCELHLCTSFSPHESFCCLHSNSCRCTQKSHVSNESSRLGAGLQLLCDSRVYIPRNSTSCGCGAPAGAAEAVWRRG